ncbi:hypothetical protein GQ44DRAFT_832237 [Phaeosphaeriaceae sp. PMI808]|nr:hypothetical protein GQ44DRAFT_832237 [Phaeosphaeriaceae sp. PMI808]
MLQDCDSVRSDTSSAQYAIRLHTLKRNIFQSLVQPDSATAPKLGSIFSTLSRLTGPLNQQDTLPIPSTLINKSTSANFHDTASKSFSGSLGLNANILQGLAGSGEIAYGFSREQSKTYTCDELETIEFEPNKEFVEESINASQDVQKFLEYDVLRRNRVYMVTGLKIATGFNTFSSKETLHGPVLKVGVDATAFGVPGEVGPQIELETGGARTTELGKAMNRVVFAHRVVRIRRRRNLQAKYTDISGGKYSVDDDEEEEDESYDVESLNKEDWLEEVPDSVWAELGDE